MTAWRPALRLARRLVRRHLGRSILIAALVAVPVAAATVTDGLIRTAVAPDTDRYWEMGTADARVSAVEAVDIAGLLPAGSRAAVAGIDEYVQVRLAVGDRRVRAYVLVAKPGDVLTEHVVRLSSGRLPRGAGEVLMNEPLTERLGLLADGQLRPAATATMVDGPPVRVTGLAMTPGCGSCETVVAPPGSALADAASPSGRVRYAVDLPAGTDVDALGRTLAGAGVDVAFRETFVDSGTFFEFLAGASGSVAVLAGLGMLEIVLLAGAAFAVGARRQVRELGLIAANGGTAKHLRRVMLAQGLVLGVLGAGSGVLLGAIVTVLGMPLWQWLSYPLVTDLRFGWIELTVVAVLAVLACVVAALVPAIGVARMRPVDALAARFRTTATAARLPVLGVLVLLAGATWLVVAGVQGRHQVADWRARVGVSEPPVTGILAGAALMVIGLILVAPALVAAAGRLGGRLPLSGRLAVREAGRHRYRTVAAIAAIMIAVAGSVATAFVFGAQAVDDPKTLPGNTAYLEPDTLDQTRGGQREQLDWAAARLTAALPGAAAHELVTFDENGAKEMSPVGLWPPDGGAQGCEIAMPTLGAGTPAMIELTTGRTPDAGLRAALTAGKVVVFDDCLLGPAGTVRTVMEAGAAPTELPAYVAERAEGTEDYNWLPGAFISTQAAAEHGWTPVVAATVVTYSATADQDEVEAQFATVAAAGLNVVVDEDEAAKLTPLFLLLAGGSALVTLLGVGVTVALSAAEGRTDLATLAALGAQPRRRRAIAGAHALVIGGLGTLLGLLLGGCVGYAAIPMAYLSGFAVPWPHLGLTAVGVPCLAVAVAMAATRSRLPMIQRRGS